MTLTTNQQFSMIMAINIIIKMVFAIEIRILISLIMGQQLNMPTAIFIGISMENSIEETGQQLNPQTVDIGFSTKNPHREDGLATQLANGTKYWFQNGKLHREDGPAIDSADGTKCWYQQDKLHREDGPAIEHANGDKKWYVNGKEILNPTKLAEANPIKTELTKIMTNIQSLIDQMTD